MATKIHKITEWYHVQLDCDKCGTPITTPSQYDTEVAQMRSTCPNCGAIIWTGKISYPHTRYEYLTEGTVVEDEGPVSYERPAPISITDLLFGHLPREE